MADITMCEGENCPKKDECYRYTAIVNIHWQSYFMETPIKNGECQHFITNKYR